MTHRKGASRERRPLFRPARLCGFAGPAIAFARTEAAHGPRRPFEELPEAGRRRLRRGYGPRPLRGAAGRREAGPAIRASVALSRRIDPEAYAGALARFCGLGAGAEAAARERNRGILHLMRHAADEAGWTMGGDGAIYAERDAGLVRVSVSTGPGGGFDVDLVEGSMPAGHGHPAMARAQALLGEGLDIDEATSIGDARYGFAA